MTSPAATPPVGISVDDAEGTGLGWENTATILAKDIDQPNTCKMKRPSGA